MTLSIVVVCEAAADKRTGCELADRVVQSEHDWVEPEHLDHLRSYRGWESAEEFLSWQRVPDLASELGIRIHGFFENQPGDLDAQAARRALLVLREIHEPLHGILLLRDADDQPIRRVGLEQARKEARDRWQLTMPIVIGVANPKRECWVLCGFEPRDDSEKQRLERLRHGDELGYDPTAKAERLTAKQRGAKNDAKRVLSALTEDDPEREAACWCETPLETLAAKGTETDLADYLREVRTHLAPLFRPQKP